MKYAIIADIHGNLPAFEAVLEDAKVHDVDMYLLLGDYTNCFPWGNDVVNTIRGLDSAAVVGGNGEGYLADIYKRKQTDFSHNQFKPVYWAYNSLSQDNLHYLINLPESLTVPCLGGSIHLSHTIDIVQRHLFTSAPRHITGHAADYFNPYNFHFVMMKSPMSHEEHLICARDALLSCSDAITDIKALPNGVYLFAHNHFQFHMEYAGKLFINPGSCGDAIDWDTVATYTLLTCQDGHRNVTERRIKYNMDTVTKGIDTSGFTAYSPIWSDVIKLQLRTAKNYFSLFVVHLVETGKAMGLDTFPVSNEVWDIATKTWDPSKL